VEAHQFLTYDKLQVRKKGLLFYTVGGGDLGKGLAGTQLFE